MDANPIVYKLCHQTLISFADLSMITRTAGVKEQNQLLYDCFKEKLDEEALKQVCDIISTVEGNPRMKCLGEEMKNQLES